MAINRIWKPSPNYSSRGGSAVRLITVHTSEGATTNQNLANFICQSSAQASYHISVDNTSSGVCYEYVSRPNKAWAQCNANPVAVTGCFCTPSGASSGWSRDYWLNNQMTALKNMAQWVKEESDYWGIPLKALTDSEAQGSGKGVCQHENLGSWGCGHYDCGPGFPMDKLLELAGGTAPPDNGVRFDDDMGAITQTPHTVPVPPGATKVVVTADPGGQGTQSIAVRVALHNNGTAGWEVNNLSLTQDKPVASVSTSGHDSVSMQVNGNYEAGYGFA